MSTKTLTIYGLTAEISAPFTEGHVCTAAEAKALNQTRTENISNNVRKAIGDLRNEDGTFTAEAQAKALSLIAEADAKYVFTLINVGSGRKVVDPVEREAISIAKAGLTAKLKERNETIKGYDEKNGEGAFATKVEEVAQREDVRKVAAKRVKERAAASEGFDI
ncbi:MAG: hypothetical protein HC888_01650 [Candidatus Competibacteraceae bacterium]|nr:hypothetical protein [Candidatus Competibacteraceae bacterium]